MKTIQWIDVGRELPDDEITVLVALADGEVTAGFHAEGIWRDLTASPIYQLVTHWAHFPEPPNAKPETRNPKPKAKRC